MTGETSYKPAAKDSEQTDKNLPDVGAVEPQDITYQGGYTKDPAEIVSNPAVAPQMPDDTVQNLRGDLKREE